jgi:hypothetical protein
MTMGQSGYVLDETYRKARNILSPIGIKIYTLMTSCRNDEYQLPSIESLAEFFEKRNISSFRKEVISQLDLMKSEKLKILIDYDIRDSGEIIIEVNKFVGKNIHGIQTIE